MLGSSGRFTAPEGVAEARRAEREAPIDPGTGEELVTVRADDVLSRDDVGRVRDGEEAVEMMRDGHVPEFRALFLASAQTDGEAQAHADQSRERATLSLVVSGELSGRDYLFHYWDGKLLENALLFEFRHLLRDRTELLVECLRVGAGAGLQQLEQALRFLDHATDFRQPLGDAAKTVLHVRKGRIDLVRNAGDYRDRPGNQRILLAEYDRERGPILVGTDDQSRQPTGMVDASAISVK